MKNDNVFQSVTLDFVQVTESAAIAAFYWIGRGDKNAADLACVNQMRTHFNQIDFLGTVVIGEGEKDQAPLLYTGERVGRGKKPDLDLAVDPLECTDSVAYGRYNAMSVMAAGEKGSLLHAPDTYMNKIAVGPNAKHVIDLEAPTKTNIQKVAKALSKKVDELTIVVLDRARHTELISEIRQTGARIRLITDGDIAGAIAPSMKGSDVDMLMGIGASAEAVLAACAIKNLGGELLCKFTPGSSKDEKSLALHGIMDLKQIYSVNDLALGQNVIFVATGVIDGPLLKGVYQKKPTTITHSIVIGGKDQVRYFTTHHST